MKTQLMANGQNVTRELSVSSIVKERRGMKGVEVSCDLTGSTFSGASDNKDVQSIIDVVMRWGRALDSRNWDLARTCFSDRIHVDYTALRGGGVEVELADEFVKKRRIALGHLDCHHVTQNHHVLFENCESKGSSEVVDVVAICTSDLMIYRTDRNFQVDRVFNSFGRYTHRLKINEQGNWVIVGVKQVITRHEGNPLVHKGVPVISGSGDEKDKK